MPKVLVVDDSLSVRKVVERALEARQMKVLSVALGSEAIERIERDEPDLVVCDVLLPDKDGYQVCEFVKRHPRLGQTPVLLISGIVNDSVLQRAAEAQSNEVLRKPFSAEELTRKIDDLLSKGRTPAVPLSGPRGHVEPGPNGPAGTRLQAASSQPEATAEVSSAAALPTSPAEEVRSAPGTTPPRGDLRTCLAQFTTVPGLRLAVVADCEGFLIESAGEMGAEAQMLGAMASCLADSSDGPGRELGQGALQGMILEYERGMVLLHGLGTRALLAMVLQEPGALGKVRYYVKKALPELVGALG